MLLAQLLTAVAFTWIYLKGKEAKPWLAQGIRYGVAVALLATIPVNLVHYAVMPFPRELVPQAGELRRRHRSSSMGIVLAWINR